MAPFPYDLSSWLASGSRNQTSSAWVSISLMPYPARFEVPSYHTRPPRPPHPTHPPLPARLHEACSDSHLETCFSTANFLAEYSPSSSSFEKFDVCRNPPKFEGVYWEYNSSKFDRMVSLPMHCTKISCMVGWRRSAECYECSHSCMPSGVLRVSTINSIREWLSFNVWTLKSKTLLPLS